MGALYQSFTYRATNLSTNPVGDAPSGITGGNFEYLIAFCAATGGGTYSAGSSGFSVVTTSSQGAWLIKKTAAGDVGASTYTFGYTNALANSRIFIFRFTQVHDVTPIDNSGTAVINTTSSSGANLTSGPITSTNADGTILGAFIEANATDNTIQIPGTFTLINRTTASPARMCGYETGVAAGTYSRQWTNAGGASRIHGILMLRSAAQDFVQNPSDAVTTSDAPVKAVTKAIPNDTAAFTDAPSKRPTKNLTDSTGTLTDAISSKAVGKSPSDSVTATDGTPAKAATKAPTDSTTLSDSISKEIVKSITGDAVTPSDELVKAVTKALADTVTATDGISIKEVGKALTDSVSLSDAVAKAVAKVIADTVTVTDSLSKSLGSQVDLSDQVTLSDALVKAVAKAISDTVTPTDQIAKEVWKGIGDTVTMLDGQPVLSVGKFITNLDFVNLTDSILLSLGIGRTLSDTVSMSDEIVRKDVGKGLSDTVTMSDEISIKDLDKHPADTITPTDATAKDVTKLISDVVFPTDTTIISLGSNVTPTDFVDVSDQIQKKDLGKFVGDTVSMSDEPTLTTGVERNPEDTVFVTDAIIVSHGHVLYLSDALCAQSDFPVVTPTKNICGYIFDHESLAPGAVIAGAIVRLFRAQDDLMVQQTVSDGLGFYQFFRDEADPYTYYVTAEYTSGPTQIHGISDRGLEPEPV